MESLVGRLARLRIVLVEPTYNGNLGQVARAMSNFGLRRLALVGGKADPSSDEARWFARDEAEAVLESAERFDSLREAVADCKRVIGTSRRLGRRRGTGLSPEALFREERPWDRDGDTALVFGREADGLTTLELDQCQSTIWIPTDPGHPSLNLAHAVAIVGYALSSVAREELDALPERDEIVPAEREPVEAMFQHARRVWLRIGYLHPQNPDAILRAWRKIFARTEVDARDVRVVRALLRQTEWVAKVAGLPQGGPGEDATLFDKHGENKLTREEGE